MSAARNKDKKVFTTGDVARMLSVNINTVIKWFDDGRINGFRLPMSNDRRIPINALRQFMIDNNIPMDLLGENVPIRREHERVTVADEIEFTVNDGKTYGPYRGYLADLSKGGARLVAKGEESIAIPMHAFRLNLTVKDGPLANTMFPGEIVHMQPADEQLSIGMRFDKIDPFNTEKLNGYIREHQI